MPVSAFPVDGTFPTGTAKYEKRAIAKEIPIWDPDVCIDCGKCAIVCPHATIRPRDEIDFFPVSEDHLAHMTAELPEVIPTHVRRQLGCDDAPNRRFDTVIMGRATYQQGLDQDITDPYAHLRTVVASRAADPPGHGWVEVTRDPARTVRALKAEDGDQDIWLAGGDDLAGVLAGEIDRLILKVYPVVAGSGRPVLAGHFDPAGFTVAEERSFTSGCVQRTYVRSG